MTQPVTGPGNPPAPAVEPVPEPAVEPAEAPEKRVVWAELFFDLVFVVAVTRVSAYLVEHTTWGGLLRALIVFVPVYWLWVGTAIQTNLQDANRPAVRLRIFLVALAAVFLAVALPEAYGDLGVLFGAAYWAGRLVLGVGVVGTALRAGRVPVNPFSLALVVTGPAFLVGGFLPAGPREVVWGTAALLDLSSPSLLARFNAGLHFDAGHLTERFGLFVLIALGESVVAVAGTASDHLTVAQGCAVAAAFVLVAGLWWVYFHFAADAIRHSLATARSQLDVTRLVLSYGHLVFIAAVVLVAVGLHEAIHDPTHHPTWRVALLLHGGAALFLAAFGFTRWAMFRLVSWTRLTTAAVVLVTLPVAHLVPALADLVVVAAAVVTVNVVEYARVTGLPAWPGSRRASTTDGAVTVSP